MLHITEIPITPGYLSFEEVVASIKVKDKLVADVAPRVRRGVDTIFEDDLQREFSCPS